MKFILADLAVPSILRSQEETEKRICLSFYMAESYRVNPALLKGVREADYTELPPTGAYPIRFLECVKSKSRWRFYCSIASRVALMPLGDTMYWQSIFRSPS